MTSLVVIPARFASKRLPGKPLLRLAGYTVLERVVGVARRTAQEAGCAVVVATDDPRIAEHCESLEATCVMTDPSLRSGSDRVLAAALSVTPTPDFVINLQGDAPFTEARHLVALIRRAAESTADVLTPVVRLSWEALDALRRSKQQAPFSGTTCIVGRDGLAHWFSKAILPAIRNEVDLRTEGPLSPVFRHVGVYGYRLDSLQRFTRLPSGHYEQLEGLEQLRFIENGMSIEAVGVPPPRLSMGGIDSPEDALVAERLIAAHGDPHVTG